MNASDLTQKWVAKELTQGDIYTYIVGPLRADDINRTALWLYVAFLYNVAPANWREKLKDGQ